MRRLVFVLLAMLTGMASGQWLEETVYVPDLLCGGLTEPISLAYAPDLDEVYVGGDSGTCVIVLNGTSGEKVARIETGYSARVLVYNPVTQKVYAVAGGWLSVIDAVTHSVDTGFPQSGHAITAEINTEMNKLYVRRYFPGLLYVVDCSNNQTIAQIPVTNTPRGELRYIAAHNKLYLANMWGGLIVVDCLTDTISARISAGSWPDHLCYDSLYDRVYSSDYYGQVSVIDAASDTIIRLDTVPGHVEKICFNSSDRKLYVANSSGWLYIYSVSGDSLVRTDSHRFSGGAVDLVYNAGLNRVYCLLTRDGTSWIDVLDGRTNELIAQILPDRGTATLCLAWQSNRLFGANRRDGDVSVIDCTGDTLLGHITLNGFPHALAYSSVSRKLYTANRGSGDISVIDGRTNQVLNSIPVGAGPWSLAYNPDDDRIYCGLDASGQLAVIDCARDSVLYKFGFNGTIRDLCYSPMNGKLYVAMFDGVEGQVAIIDGSTNRLLRVLNTGKTTHVLYHNPISNKAYAGNFGDGTVTVINGETDLVIRTIPVGHGPSAFTHNTRDNRIYCANQGSRSISVIDGNTDRVIATLPVERGWPIALCYNETENKVYAQSYCDDVRRPKESWLTIWNATTHDFIGRHYLGWRSACSLYYNPQSNRVYSVSFATGDVTVIDGRTDQVISRFYVGTRPVSFAANTADGRIYVNLTGSSAVAVIRDTVGVGVSDQNTTPLAPSLPTIIRGSLNLSQMTSNQFPMTMHDAAGRKVMDLQPGENDVRHLAPGVYFIRSALWERSPDRDFIRKVVIQR